MTFVKEAVARHLAGWTGLSGVQILWEYPKERAFPLKGPTLVVGLDGVDLSPAGLDNYLGRDPSSPTGQVTALYGSTAILTLRLDLYLPGSDGSGCHRLYEEVCAALTARAAGFGLLRIWCEAVKYESAAAASRLTARAALRAAFTGRETEAEILDYQVRSELNV